LEVQHLAALMLPRDEQAPRWPRDDGICSTLNEGISLMHSRTSAAIAVMTVLYGCASTPQLPPIRDGAAVTIEVSMPAQAKGSTEIENTALGHDTSTGAKAGAVAGGLWGLVCGPLAVFCIPAGAGIGAIYGTVAGAGIGLTGALSNEKATQLRERLQRSMQANPPIDELRRNVAERARQHWRVTTADASVTVTVELQDLVLTSNRDEQIGLIVHVRVSARPGGAGGTVSQKVYEYVAPSTSLAVWLDEHNDFVETSIRLAMQQLATQIVSELARG
jgi:hypothetical protein